MFSKIIHIEAFINVISFIAEEHSIVWIDPILYMYLSADEHLDCFYFLAIMNNATVNIYVQGLVDICVHFSWLHT